MVATNQILMVVECSDVRTMKEMPFSVNYADLGPIKFASATVEQAR